MVGARGWGSGEWELVFNGHEVCFARQKISGELLSNDVNIFNTTELYTLKWLRW